MSKWINLKDRKPKDGQKCIVAVHAWCLCTDGKKSFERDEGVFVLPTFYVEKPWPCERGFFIDGFAFDDNAFPFTYHHPPKIKYWQEYNTTAPDDA